MPLAFAPERRFGTTEWAIVGGATLLTLAAQLLSPGPLKNSSAYVIALLPGLLTALVFRSLLAGAAVTLAPMYFIIGFVRRGLPAHAPMLALDYVWPLRPEWMLVYGSLYIFVVILPFSVIRDRELGQRTLRAYIAVMLVAYTGFVAYPTVAPVHGPVGATGFSAWTLQLAYDLDTPNNCLPSLHVAYAFVAALACWRVHRGVGAVAVVWAGLIGLSTLFTKQHYVVDVITGALMGWLAYMVFIRAHERQSIAPAVRSGAVRRAGVAAMAYVVMVVAMGVIYAFTV
jgi:membrane-associated phospholipid phosphatase